MANFKSYGEHDATQIARVDNSTMYFLSLFIWNALSAYQLEQRLFAYFVSLFGFTCVPSKQSVSIL